MDLAKRHTVRELVAAFEAAEATTRRCFAELHEANVSLCAAFSQGNIREIRIDASYRGTEDDFDDADRAVARMQRQAWEVIVDKLELRRMMSTSRFTELQKRLQEGPLPPITEEAVIGFAQHYANELPKMIEEAVREVYDWLRPWSEESRGGQYKTNRGAIFHEVGPRVVKTCMVERHFLGSGFRVRFGRSQQELVCLENVFRAFDGGGNIGREHYSVLERAINESGNAGVGETEYFGFRACKNGNLHLHFKRLDLLARFNQVAGGKRLGTERKVA